MRPLVTQHSNGVALSVRVKPRARQSAVLGVRERFLEVAVAAPPVDGKANSELEKTLAEHFGVAANRVSVVSGATGKLKIVLIAGLTTGEAEARLAPRRA